MQTQPSYLLLKAGGLVLASLLAAPEAASRPLEPAHSGWSLYLDNDLLVPAPRDQDYTGGLSITQAGRNATRGLSLDPLLGGINSRLGMEEEAPDAGRQQLHARQLGFAIFTPGDMEKADLSAGDRPYASLLYLANTRLMLDPQQADTVHQTTLTLGVLGLPLTAELQQGFHELIGSQQPQGWQNQISDGGEPTFRYSHAVQKLLRRGQWGTLRYEIKPSVEAGVGFITDANAAISVRLGRINTPWWSFAPDRAEYFSQPSPGLAGQDADADSDAPRELYAWAGAKARVRPWNALLQGQFRRSDLSYDPSEVRPLLFEAWAGITRQVNRDYWLSWVLRYQSSELRTPLGDRDLLWGSLFINRHF